MIDFHCHLDLYPDPVAAAGRCRESGDYVLSVTTTPNAWDGTKRLTQGLPRVRTALGFHPQVAHEREGELPLFEGLLPGARYVGEVGLDGSPDWRRHWDVQARCFDRVLRACSRQGGRVMTIHSRGAPDEVMDGLARQPNAGLAVLHWFSGTKAQLDRAAAMECWFSVGPSMTRSRKGAALLAAMPRDRVLTETDGPFARSRGRALAPGEVSDAVGACAEAWRLPTVDAQAVLDDNLRRLSDVARP